MSTTFESPTQYMSENTSAFSPSDNESATQSPFNQATQNTHMNQEFMNVIQSRTIQSSNWSKISSFYRHQTIEDLTPIDSNTLSDLISKNNQLLIIDVRSFSYFSTTRIKSAVNVSIPSILLKRPTYTIEKVCDSITYDDLASNRLKQWSNATHIVFYDHSSYSPSDSGNSTTAILLGSKLRSVGYNGQLNYLQGGFKEFYELHGNQCEIGPLNQQKQQNFNRAKRPTNIQLPLPTSLNTTGVNPFFTNIRQNLELSHGPLKERFNVRLPWGLKNEDGCISSPVSLNGHHPRFGLAGSSVDRKGNFQLPNWIADIMNTENGPKKLAEMYEILERTEQKRLSTIMKHHSKQNMCDDHFPFSIASSMEKGALNRYNNIWPYDYSRVKLNQKNDDYINANYIQYADIKKNITHCPIIRQSELVLEQDGILSQASLRTMDPINVDLDSNRKYISTQGPLPTTFDDFWKLIWDESSFVIVMLTQEIEMNKIKCHRYWPSTINIPQTYGQITVTLLSESIQSVFNMNDKRERNDDDQIIIRKFSLKRKNTERIITQLQYTGWTDFGVPDQPIGLLQLVHHADEAARYYQSRNIQTGPMTVHCSAGCGRSGTFCVVDTIIQRLSHERDVYTSSSIDKINETVSRFREQRMSMVQTHRQFVFCYEAVLWWLLGYGSLPVSPVSPSEIACLGYKERDSSIGSIVDDFKEL